jgi:hypothetical protein
MSLRSFAGSGCIAAIFCVYLSVNVSAQPVGDDTGGQPSPSQAQQQPQRDNTPLILDAVKSESERIGRAIESLKDDSDAKAKEDRERRDVIAQETMAFWAAALFWATSVTIILTIVGLLLIFKTMGYSRDAARAAANMVTEGENATKAALLAAQAAGRQAELFEQSFKRSERPYIFFLVHETHGLRNAREDRPFLSYQLVNRGKLPAIIRSVSIGLLDNPTRPLKSTFAAEDKRHFVIEAGGVMIARKLEVVANKRKTYAGEAGANLVIYGLIRYDDPTGARHIDSFCMRGTTDASYFTLEGDDEYNWRKTEYPKPAP